MWDAWHVANQNHRKKGQILVQANKFLYTEMEAFSLYIHVTMKTHSPSVSNI